MGFWFWFWICCGIVALGASLQLLIMVRLALKAKQLAEPAKRLQAIGESLNLAATKVPEIPNLVAALDQPLEQVLARRRRILKAKRLRREARERRLVARLKTISYQESRLR